MRQILRETETEGKANTERDADGERPKEMEAGDRVINQLTDKPTERSSETHKTRQKVDREV